MNMYKGKFGSGYGKMEMPQKARFCNKEKAWNTSSELDGSKFKPQVYM